MFLSRYRTIAAKYYVYYVFINISLSFSADKVVIFHKFIDLCWKYALKEPPKTKSIFLPHKVKILSLSHSYGGKHMLIILWCTVDLKTFFDFWRVQLQKLSEIFCLIQILTESKIWLSLRLKVWCILITVFASVSPSAYRVHFLSAQFSS